MAQRLGLYADRAAHKHQVACRPWRGGVGYQRALGVDVAVEQDPARAARQGQLRVLEPR